jgi:ketosteroid isomerase-like protein
MNRNHIEATLHDAYSARSRNDAAGVLAVFAADATLKHLGHPAYCDAVATYIGPALGPAMEKLCDVFRASAWDARSMIIEGNRAAVICRASLQYTPTGESLSLDLVHFWTFQDGKVTELMEYFDTALVAHVMTQAPVPSGR